MFLLLLPAAAASEHLNALAAVARMLRDPGVLGSCATPRHNGLHRAMTD
jgi:mannitol/fructose-specific phosphotransferase system IIA component (Ntr-type)